MFDLCEEKNWKTTFEKINVLEKKPHKPRQRGGVGSHFMYGGSEFSLPFFFIQESSCRNVQISKNLYFMLSSYFPCNFTTFEVQCGLVWCGLRVMDQQSSLGTVLWPPTICLRIAALQRT